MNSFYTPSAWACPGGMQNTVSPAYRFGTRFQSRGTRLNTVNKYVIPAIPPLHRYTTILYFQGTPVVRKEAGLRGDVRVCDTVFSYLVPRSVIVIQGCALYPIPHTYLHT